MPIVSHDAQRFSKLLKSKHTQTSVVNTGIWSPRMMKVKSFTLAEHMWITYGNSVT